MLEVSEIPPFPEGGGAGGLNRDGHIFRFVFSSPSSGIISEWPLLVGASL